MKFCFRRANHVLHLTIVKIFKFLWTNRKLKNRRVPAVTESACLCFALVMGAGGGTVVPPAELICADYPS